MAPVTPEQTDTKSTPLTPNTKPKPVVPTVAPPARSSVAMYALFPTTPPTAEAPASPNITVTKPTSVIPAASATGACGVPHKMLPTAPTIMTLAPVTTGRKRKPDPVKGSKRVRKTIIDDEVALSLFRELRCSNEFLYNGKVLAWALQPDDEDYINIHHYVARGQEHGFGLKIITILRVVVNANNLYQGAAPLEHQLDFNENPNTKGKRRAMLWHGTESSNLVSILENGLRLPMECGQMFGPGIYFADRISKSARYCGRTCRVAYLFLCDVLLGDNIYRAYTPFSDDSFAPRGVDSVMGVGRRIPNPEMDMEIDGCSWPLGQTIDNPDRFAWLQYNEYIVYNVSQVKPKCLVKVEFTRNPVHEKLF